jgi:hypothetical protein
MIMPLSMKRIAPRYHSFPHGSAAPAGDRGRPSIRLLKGISQAGCRGA